MSARTLLHKAPLPALLAAPAMAALVLAAAAPARAQQPLPAPAAPASAPAQAAEPASPAEPAVQHVVIEDGGSRVEELRVRGQVRRITVTPKNGSKPYEIIPADGARDLSPGPGSTKGAAGQRVWNVFDF
jgi:hypothetical protein